MADAGSSLGVEALAERAEQVLDLDIMAVEPLVPDGRRHRVIRCRFDGGSVVVKDAGQVEVDAYRRLSGR